MSATRTGTWADATVAAEKERHRRESVAHDGLPLAGVGATLVRRAARGVPGKTTYSAADPLHLPPTRRPATRPPGRDARPCSSIMAPATLPPVAHFAFSSLASFFSASPASGAPSTSVTTLPLRPCVSRLTRTTPSPEGGGAASAPQLHARDRLRACRAELAQLGVVDHAAPRGASWMRSFRSPRLERNLLAHYAACPRLASTTTSPRRAHRRGADRTGRTPLARPRSSAGRRRRQSPPPRRPWRR